MTARQPTDSYLSPPCTALALRRWLWPRCAEVLAGHHIADPFGGAGTLLPWTVGDDAGSLLRCHAFELSPLWLPELETRLAASRVRICDSLGLADWSVMGGRVQPHIVTNPPYRYMDESIRRLHDHARTHHRWVCALTRLEWWQHEGGKAKRDGTPSLVRRDYMPDDLLILGWRPSFGFRRDKAGKIVKGTDKSTGYAWCVWRPVAAAPSERRYELLTRPLVAKGLKDEHSRVARLAFGFGVAA